MGEVTLLIARKGDREAFDRIFELLYPELRPIAHRRLARGARDGLIETTALVNECYVKFIQRKALTPTDRSHFLAYSATVMRPIIVDAEIAEALGLSTRTVRRDWDKARLLLAHALRA